MEGTAERVRELAFGLHEVQPWSKNGTIQKILDEMQEMNLIKTGTDVLCIDSTSIRVHPDAAGARKSNGDQDIGRSKKGGMTTKLHLCCTSERYAFAFHLSARNRHDAPEDRKLIGSICSGDSHPLLMDRAYEDDKTHALAASRQRKTGGSHGIMTVNFINAATR